MAAPKQPTHLLSKRSLQLLEEYTRLGDKRSPEEYQKVMKRIITINANAFHTQETLSTRRFWHCPNRPIPYLTCLIPAKTL